VFDRKVWREAMLRDPLLDPTVKLVGLHVWVFSGNDGLSDPGGSFAMATDLNLTVSTVMACLRRLEKDGWLRCYADDICFLSSRAASAD